MLLKAEKQVGEWSKAEQCLQKADPVLAKIIARVGPCRLRARKDYFGALCHAIFSQQISTVVADKLFQRFRANFPRRIVTAKGVCAMSEAQLTAAGLSRQKKSYIRDLGEKFACGAVATKKFSRMNDEEIIEALTVVRGIGRWTAEMFLMFVMNRPDVWPVDDFGLQSAVKKAYGMRSLPKKKLLMKLGEKWRPWRTVASWYFWRGM